MTLDHFELALGLKIYSDQHVSIRAVSVPDLSNSDDFLCLRTTPFWLSSGSDQHQVASDLQEIAPGYIVSMLVHFGSTSDKR